MINIKDLCCRDPFFIKEGDYYYLVASKSNSCRLGFLVYRTKNLVDFEKPKTIFEESQSFWAHQDYWAPEIHKYKGKYYLLASLKNPKHTRGTQIFVSDTIDGQYTPITKEPITPLEWECLDGTLFIENGTPFIIFCHEWLQIKDGEMCAMPLSYDLTTPIGKPVVLFKASDAPWVRPHLKNNFITDGPFIIRQDDTLIMIWSSLGADGYAMGVATSKSILGPWKHRKEPLFNKDGGHGMVFEKDGKQLVAIHCPNGPAGFERIKFLDFNGEELI